MALLHESTHDSSMEVTTKGEGKSRGVAKRKGQIWRKNKNAGKKANVVCRRYNVKGISRKSAKRTCRRSNVSIAMLMVIFGVSVQRLLR